MTKKELEIMKLANNALYFNDISDYLSALWDILKVLKPDLDNHHEFKFMDDKENEIEDLKAVSDSITDRIENLKNETFTITLYLKDRVIDLNLVDYDVLKGFYNVMYHELSKCVVINNVYIKTESINVFTVTITGNKDTVISLKELNERNNK